MPLNATQQQTPVVNPNSSTNQLRTKTEVKTFEDLEPEEELIQELNLISVGPIEQVALRERDERNQQF